jgi:hypothetical protein
MDLEIQDEQGNNRHRQTKGINVVTWDSQYENPKSLALENSIICWFYCATCSRGNYKVVMTKGKDTYTHTLKY